MHSQRRFVVITLGSRTFSIAAGQTATVKVKLPVTGYRLLVRLKRLPATARLKYAQPSGGTTTATRTITLRASTRR